MGQCEEVEAIKETRKTEWKEFTKDNPKAVGLISKLMKKVFKKKGVKPSELEEPNEEKEVEDDVAAISAAAAAPEKEGDGEDAEEVKGD